MATPHNMEEIIQRAAMALGVGVSEEEVADTIQETETSEIAFLAIQAAKIYNKEPRLETSDTIPAPPIEEEEND